MLQQLRTAAVLFIALTVLTGIAYPLLVTAIAQAVFPRQANASLIEDGEQVVGSELIGQPFARPEYFWGRLSATVPTLYNASASSGSNYGPLHPDLKDAAEARMAALQAGAARGGKVPVDLVTASGSGLDPHISPAAAEYQVPRIAASRKITEDDVRELIRQHTENRQFGVLGEPRVNVLRLNMALQQQQNTQ
jgi:K+-transporting ATPase ATPase C chain